MERLFKPLLVYLSVATDRELARQVQYRPPEIGVVLPPAVTGSSIWSKDELERPTPARQTRKFPARKVCKGSECSKRPARTRCAREGEG
jgi:hypothetical protein